MKKLPTLIVPAWLGLLLLITTASAQNLFVNGNFETGATGAAPPAPWSVTASAGQGTAEIASGSSSFGNVFSIGSRSVLLTDASADASPSPILSQTFPTQTEGPLTLSFDFRMDGALTNTPWVIDLRPANGTAMHIRFLVDYGGNQFQVQNGGQLSSVLTLAPNTWYHVRAHIDLLSRTYSGTITPYGGTAGSWTHAAFGTSQSDVGGIVISDGAPSVTGAPLRLDNFHLGKRKGVTDGLAEGLIEDNFDHHLAGTGSAPPAPWSAAGSGLSFTLATSAESPFVGNTVTGKGLLVTDNSTTGGASAGIEQRFLPPSPADPLLISFDFRVDDFGGNSLVPTFRLIDSTGTAGIFLHLWKDGQVANIRPNNTTQNLRAISLGTWYHAVVAIESLDGASSTYTLKLTADGGTTTTHANLPFRVSLNDAGKIAFVHNSNGLGTGRWAIDNIVMGGVADRPRQNMWPFTQPSIASLRAAPKKVFAHWFSPFPVLINNAGDPGRDYYTRHYLNPAGESGKFETAGGFLRDRPLLRSATALGDRIDEDIRMAARLGIDGFALNILATTGATWDAALDLMNRAAALDSGFRVMLMPDMVALNAYDTQPIDAIRMLANHPAAHRLADGRLVVSPYAAHLRTAAWWQTQLNQLASEGIQVAFVPVFQGWWNYAASFASISHGFSDWGVRIPIWGTSRFTFPADVHQHVPVAFAPVAPQDVRPKSGLFTEADNSDAFHSHWDSAISLGADWVHLITWNDYSEHSHLAPSSRTGFALYDKTAYFTTWFKTGAAPAVTRDVLHYSYRRHRTNTLATASQTPNPFNLAPGYAAKNEIELTAFLTAPGTLEIEIAGNVTSFAAPAGLSSWSIPLAEGTPVFRLKRGGHLILEGAGRTPIDYDIEFQDHLYHSGVIALSSSAPPGNLHAAWRALHFTPGQLADPAVSGPGADPDGDGLPNLLEYAFARDPLAADHQAPFFAGSLGAGDRLVFTHFHAADRSDLSYRVEWSPDLAEWSDEPVNIVEIERVALEGGELVTHQAVRSSAEAPSQFLRLRVELQ